MSVAVVGTGFMGPVHVEALRRLGREVRGILGSSPEKSRAAAQRLGLERGYASLEQLLADEAVRVVHVTSPNHTHLAYAKAALEAGRHVVCEKPLARTAAETRELAKLARAHPELLAVVHYNLRYYPMVLQMRHLVRSGAIGEVRHVTGSYVQDWLLHETDWNWRVLADEGGALRTFGDIGTHWLDMMGFVTGLRVESLVADLATFLPIRRRPVGASGTFGGAVDGAGDAGDAGDAAGAAVEVDTEDYGSVLLRLAGGARGALHVSQVQAGRKNRMTLEVAGSEASVTWVSDQPNDLWIGHRDRPNELLTKDPALLAPEVARFVDYPGGHAAGYPDTFKQLYRAIHAYLDAGDMDAPRDFPTFEDGHEEIVLLQAILDSHRSRAWHDVPREYEEARR